jgi:L-asparaginase
MKEDPATGILHPFDFTQIEAEVPRLKKFDFEVNSVSFEPIDSSNIHPDFWVRIAKTIDENYRSYDGFVVLHGTDTMAYSASMLSFMFENLRKPVIFTGSQLPIGALRTDGEENLIAAVQIAAARNDAGEPAVPEVCIYFDSQLLRGNRTTKFSAERFDAFDSFNYPPLVESGIHLRFNESVINRPSSGNTEELTVHTVLDTNVGVLKIFPGMNETVVNSVLKTEGLRSVIIETFGSGNAPSFSWFINAIADAVGRDIVALNITQCKTGSVEPDKYLTGNLLKKAGVLSGNDITFEAGLTKLFYLQGKYLRNNDVRMNLLTSLRGEISI